MIGPFKWLFHPWQCAKEAELELEKSRSEVERVSELSRDLRQIQRENHITAKIHAAFRGELP